MRLYADATAYETYNGLAAGTAPANVDALLRTASRTVDRLVRGVEYDTDTDGLPTDADVTQALSDATCAIARELDANGTLEAGGTTEWSQVGIGSVSLGGRTHAEGAVAVDGVLVPADAVAALAALGPVRVVSL